MIESLRRRASRFGLDVVLVNLWEGGGAAEESAGYCQRWGIEGTVLLDERAEFARQLGIRGVPTNVFVDADGVVRSVGATTSAELLAGAAELEPQLRGLTVDMLAPGYDPSDFDSDQAAGGVEA